MLSLRPATAEDLPALVDVARRSWLSAFQDDAPAALIELWRSRDREPSWYAQYWPSMTVACRDGRVVGVTQPLGDEVNGLWVEPEAQGAGIGRLLLRHAEREIAAGGNDRAWLTCSGFNRGALRFYLREGYREIRRTRKELAPGLVDEAVILERSLEGD